MYINQRRIEMLAKRLLAIISTPIAFLLAASPLIFASLSTPAWAAVNIQHWQTSQGVRVYFVENHDLPIVDLSVSFPAGSARDSAEKSGLAGMTRHMMTTGAGGMNEEQISSRLADVGASLGGDMDADRASFKLRTLSSAQEKTAALTVFKAILHQPEFSTSILEREKSRMMASLRESQTQPDYIAGKAFMQSLYGQHPYAPEESPETVATIERADLLAFYQQHFTAKGAVIAMIADMSRSEAETLAEQLATGLPQGAAPSALPPVTYPEQAQLQKLSHPATQSHLLLGYPGIKRGDPDYFPLYVGNYILGGGGFVSLLTEEVREKRGLAYSVYSYFIPQAELGPFQIGLQTKREQADAALKVVQETLASFMKNGITPDQLKAAKQNLIGGFPLRLDSNAKILDYLAVIGFYQLPLTYLEDFSRKVSEVDVAQIREAFQRRIKPEHFVTVMVGGDHSQEAGSETGGQ